MNHFPNTSSFGVNYDQSSRRLQRKPLHKHCDGWSFLHVHWYYTIICKIEKAVLLSSFTSSHTFVSVTLQCLNKAPSNSRLQAGYPCSMGTFLVLHKYGCVQICRLGIKKASLFWQRTKAGSNLSLAQQIRNVYRVEADI